MPNLPRSGRVPHAFPAENQVWLRISNRDPLTQKFVVSGPFLATIVPTNGELTVPSANGAQMILVDKRARLGPNIAVTARAIATDVSTNTAYSVVYVGAWAGGTEIFLVRESAQ